MSDKDKHFIGMQQLKVKTRTEEYQVTGAIRTGQGEEANRVGLQ